MIERQRTSLYATRCAALRAQGGERGWCEFTRTAVACGGPDFALGWKIPRVEKKIKKEAPTRDKDELFQSAKV